MYTHLNRDSVLRRLGGCVVALALLMPAQALTAQAAPAADQRAAATTKTRMVKLGHRPVRATTADKVRLTFEGRKGQLVNLARVDATEQCGGRVLRTGGKTVKPWAQGYWRLPRTATYTAINKPCRNQDTTKVRLQLRRVVQHDAAVAGLATAIGRRTHLTHLVPVHVGTDERVGLQPSSPTVEVVGPDRRTTVADRDTVLRERGRHWVALGPESSLTTTLTVRRTAQVDGATVALPRMGTSETTQEVAFTGTADQWVYAELLDAAGNVAGDTGRDVRVWGADGREVEKVVLHQCPARRYSHCTTNGPWLLPSTGAFRMTLVPDTPDTEQPITLRLRAAVVAPELTVDGPAVSYTTTSPGQWVMSRYTDTEHGTRGVLEAANASPTLGAWTFTVAPRFPWSLNCDEVLDGNGCDEYWGAQVRPDSPVAHTPGWTTPDSWALLVVPPNAHGSVDVTLTRSAPQS
jgi:hypothetical protein